MYKILRRNSPTQKWAMKRIVSNEQWKDKDYYWKRLGFCLCKTVCRNKKIRNQKSHCMVVQWYPFLAVLFIFHFSPSLNFSCHYYAGGTFINFWIFSNFLELINPTLIIKFEKWILIFNFCSSFNVFTSKYLLVSTSFAH